MKYLAVQLTSKDALLPVEISLFLWKETICFERDWNYCSSLYFSASTQVD